MKLLFCRTLVCVGIVCWLVLGCSCNMNESAAVTYTFPEYPTSDLKNDLTYFYQKLDSVHFDLYHAHPKSDFDSLYTELQAGITEPMNAAEFYLHVLPLFSLTKDAHSNLIFPFQYSDTFSAQGGKFIPVKVQIHEGRVFIKENLSRKNIEPYTELLSVNGVNCSEITQAIQLISSDEIEGASERYQSYFFPRLLYPLYGFDQKFTLEIRDPSGKDKTLKVKGISLEEFPKNKAPFYEFSLLEDRIGYLDLNLCEGKDRFGAFCDSVFTLLKDQEIEQLIIDVRDNGGGSTFHGDTLFTYLTNQKFSQYPKVSMKMSPDVDAETDSIYTVTYDDDLEHAVDNPKRFQGNVFMLANINSFSSATVMAATFQCYDMGTLVGQETGGVQVFFDEPIVMTMPQTGIRFLCSYQLRWCPCGERMDRGILPDYTVPWRLQDQRNGVDTEIEFIKGLIQEGIEK